MSFNIFGVVWILLTLLCASKNKYLAILFLWSFIFQSACIVVIGSQAINVSVFTGLVLIVKYIVCTRKIVLRKSLKAWLVFFLISIVISIYASKNFVGIQIFDNFEANGRNILTTKPYDGSSGFYRFIILCVYIFASHFCAIYLKNSDISFEKEFRRILNFVLFFGILQFIIVFLELPIYKLYDLLLRTDPASVSLSHYFSHPRLFSTLTEPSYCSIFLVSSFWGVLMLESKSKMNKYLPLIAIEIILTFSTTAYVALLLGAFVYIYNSENKNKTLSYILLLGCSLVFATLYFMGNNGPFGFVFDKIQNSNSGVTRTVWNEMAWNNFKETHYIGMGYRTIRASSMLFNILGQLGIVGLISFAYSLYLTIITGMYGKSRTKINNFCVVFLLLTIICQVIACPDLDNCILWFAITLCLYMGEYSQTAHYSLKRGW